MLEISNKSTNFHGFKKGQFEKRFYAVNTSFDDTIAKNAENCLMKKRHLIKALAEEQRKKKLQQEMKCSWKSLRDQNVCDVESIVGLEEKQIHIKEAHQLKQINRMFAQVYLEGAWKGFNKLSDLEHHNVILESTQNIEENTKIVNTMKECLKKGSDFIVRL